MFPAALASFKFLLQTLLPIRGSEQDDDTDPGGDLRERHPVAEPRTVGGDSDAARGRELHPLRRQPLPLSLQGDWRV